MSEIQNNDTDKIAAEKYLSGEVELDSLTDEQADLAHEMFTSQQEGEQNTEGEQATETKEGQEPEKVEPVVTQDLDQNKRIAELLAESNRHKQIASDREKKLNSLKEDPEYRKKFFGDPIETKIDPEKDYLSDEHLAQVDTLKSRLEILEKRETERIERDEAHQKDLDAKAETMGLFEEIGALQSEFPQLKTSENFQKIDNKFVAWKQTALLGGVDVDEYIKNESYRKQKDEAGYKLDVSSEDMDKAMKIYGAHTKYKDAKKGGYKTSLSREFKDLPDYEEMMKSKYASHQLADDDAFNQKMKERATEVSIMNSGSAPSNVGDVEAIIGEMEVISMTTNPTEAQEKRYRELDKMLNNMNIG